MYYTPEILDLIVEKTNDYMRKPQDESCPYIRVNNWYPIYHREIYIYLVIRIYITLHIDSEIIDYWATKDITPEYLITKYLGRNRFQELYIYVRFYSNQE
jgi:hypothetical protein